MDKPRQDKGTEVVEGTAPNSSQPPTATGKSLLLPWLILGAVALLITYGKSDDAAKSADGRDARLAQDSFGEQLPGRTAEMCSDLGDLAEQTMRFRQTGGSKVDLLSVIDTRGSQETRILARAIIDDAYNSKLHSDPHLQALSIAAFRAVAEEACSSAD